MAGDLVPDTSFADGGTAHVNFEVSATAIDGENRTIVAGEGVVRRFNADGTLDTEFGNKGTRDIEIAGDPTDLLVLQDDRVVVSSKGEGDAQVALTLLNSDGSIDRDFGSDGVVMDSIASSNAKGEPSGAGAQALARHKDGFVVAANGVGDFVIVRYSTDGQRDNDFGDDGVVKDDLLGGKDEASDIAVGDDDSIVVVGGLNQNSATQACKATCQLQGAIAKYRANGTIDTRFGQDGVLHIKDIDEIPHVVLDDWDIIVGVTKHGAKNQTMGQVRRYDPAGSLEATAEHDWESLEALERHEDVDRFFAVTDRHQLVQFSSENLGLLDKPVDVPSHSLISTTIGVKDQGQVVVSLPDSRSKIRQYSPSELVPNEPETEVPGTVKNPGGGGGGGSDGSGTNETDKWGMRMEGTTLYVESSVSVRLVARKNRYGRLTILNKTEHGPVDRIVFIGSPFNDSFHNKTGIPLTAYGGGGDDFIKGGSANDELYGGEGNDKLIGRKGHDRLYGGAGDDILRGLAGRDSLFGGDGDDKLVGGRGRDSFDGGTGNNKSDAKKREGRERVNGNVDLRLLEDFEFDDYDATPTSEIPVAETVNEYRLTPDGHVVERSPSSDWTTIGTFPAAADLLRAETDVFVFSEDGKVHRFDETARSWQLIAGSEKNVQAEVWQERLFVLQSNGVVVEYLGSGTSWRTIASSPQNIKIVGSDRGLFVFQQDGKLHRYEGTGSNWQTIASSELNTQAEIWNDRLFVLQANGSLFEYLGSGTNWRTVSTNPLNSKIVASVDGLFLFQQDGKILRHSVVQRCNDLTPTYWDVIAFSELNAQIATWQDRLFVLQTNGTVAEYIRSSSSWRTIASSPQNKEILATGGGLYVFQSNGSIHRYRGTSTAWETIAGGDNLQLEIWHDRLYVLNSNGAVAQYLGSGSNWRTIASSPLNKRIEASHSGLYVLQDGGLVARYQGTSNAWETISQGNNVEIAMWHDRLHVLRSSGGIAQYFAAGFRWQTIATSALNKKIVVTDNGLYALHDSGRVYRYRGTGGSWESSSLSGQ